MGEVTREGDAACKHGYRVREDDPSVQECIDREATATTPQERRGQRMESVLMSEPTAASRYGSWGENEGPNAPASDFYGGGLGPQNWARRVAAKVKPANIDGNMGARARLWRALVDWGWGIDLDTPRLRRLLWVYRRLAPAWMPMFFPEDRL